MSDKAPIDANDRNSRLDRRVFVRTPVTTHCTYRPIQAGESILSEATIQELSAGGLRLVAHRAFRKGEMVAVELPHPIKGARDKLFVRVRHVRTTRDGLHIAGCSFVKKLAHDELEALLCAIPGWRPPLDRSRIRP
jgi:hypothetical protein